MQVERFMRRDVQALGPDQKCSEAAALMRDERVGSIVITEKERVVGMVTDRDLVERVMAAGRDPRQVRLREVMTGEPIFVSAERSLEEVVDAMRHVRVRRIAVVDDAGKLAGILSFDDIFLHLSRQINALAEVVRGAVQTALQRPS